MELLKRRPFGDRHVQARCPKCGRELEARLVPDASGVTLMTGSTLHFSEHLVLRADCVCGWEGRINNPKVLR